jgi:hypothetical protein
MVATTVKTWFEEGVEVGQRKILLVLIEERFGPLSETVRQRLEAWPGKHLIGLALALLHARSLSDLGLEDSQPATHVTGTGDDGSLRRPCL